VKRDGAVSEERSRDEGVVSTRRRARLSARHRGGRRGYGAELSPREREVAQLAAAGHTNQEIAEHQFVSVNTVKKQISAAMRKLGVRSRSALPVRPDDQI
jgi:DNA-binding CsgD family transcriptional regulator